MIYSHIKALIIAVLLIFTLVENGLPYSSKTTHKRINEYAVSYSTLDDVIIKKLGLNDGKNEIINGKEVIEWIKEGGEKEDSLWFHWKGPNYRPLRHFHDPLIEDWNDAGFLQIMGTSMILCVTMMKKYDIGFECHENQG